LSDSTIKTVSLRRLLFLWLALPLTGVRRFPQWCFTRLPCTPCAPGYDHALMDTAQSLARLTPTLAHSGAIVSDDADVVLRLDQFDRIYYSVYDSDGTLIAGDRELTAPPPDLLSAGELFYDGEIDEEAVRVGRDPCVA